MLKKDCTRSSCQPILCWKLRWRSEPQIKKSIFTWMNESCDSWGDVLWMNSSRDPKSHPRWAQFAEQRLVSTCFVSPEGWRAEVRIGTPLSWASQTPPDMNGPADATFQSEQTLIWRITKTPRQQSQLQHTFMQKCLTQNVRPLYVFFFF